MTTHAGLLDLRDIELDVALRAGDQAHASPLDPYGTGSQRFPMDIGQESSGPMIQKLNVGRIYDFLQGRVERFR